MYEEIERGVDFELMLIWLEAADTVLKKRALLLCTESICLKNKSKENKSRNCLFTVEFIHFTDIYVIQDFFNPVKNL